MIAVWGLAALPSLAQLDEAESALRDGVPEVAAEKLRIYLAENPSSEHRAATLLKLASIELAAGNPEEALATLDRLPFDEESDFCRARSLAALGRWSEAQPLFDALTESEDAKRADAARLCHAEALRALGRIKEAVAAAEAIRDPDALVQLRTAALHLDAGDYKKCRALSHAIKPHTALEKKWKQYLEARLLLAQNQPAPALFEFEQLLQDRRGVNESLLVGATFGIAEARVFLNGLEAAGDVIEEFIATHPNSARLDLMFERLDQLYESEEDPSDSELQKWTQSSPPVRAAFATYYLARSHLRQKKREKAVALFRRFTRDFAGHPLVPKAFLTLGEMLSQEGRFAPAIQALEAAIRHARSVDLIAQAEIASGRVYFRQREFVLAANTFRSAAQRAPDYWRVATFNSALAWLYQGNYANFLEDYKELSARAPESDLRRSLLLEEGLLQARTDDGRATETLQLFLEDFPEDRRAAEARVALAELAFAADDLGSASQYLPVANESDDAGAVSDRAQYLAIFLADAAQPPDDKKVIALCQEFLRQHPESTLLPEVRMKLGQVYFRIEDFAGAQTQFELLARDHPDTPLAEPALFLAGRASMRSMSPAGVDRAIELFKQVVKLNGALKTYAWAEQAALSTRLGLEKDAIILYENILAASPDPELRFAALCGKADNLYALAAKDDKLYPQTIRAFNLLANEPNVPAVWRNQALYKKARCLESQTKRGEALAVYYDVIDAQTKTAAAEPEYFWFYKAGFSAGQLLEADEKWSSAIRIYEKLAALEGPRAGEAKARASQLRLEHFVWDE